MGILDAIFSAAFEGDGLNPILGISMRYKHWVSVKDLRRCSLCEENQGRIWRMEEQPDPEPPLHPNCRCGIEQMQTIQVGTATTKGVGGADWTLKYLGELPDYYVSYDEAVSTGWRPSKWPSNFIPDKMITGGEFENKKRQLPRKDGRIWYEADIDYVTGKRNAQRVVWSNDGLIFVTYDHYQTFYEIV